MCSGLKQNTCPKAEAPELETQEEAELLLLAGHTKPKQLLESFYDHLGWLTSDVSWQRKFTSLHLALVRNVSDKARDSSGHYGKSWSTRKSCQYYQWNKNQERETKTSFLLQLIKIRAKSRHVHPSPTPREGKHQKKELFNLNNKVDTRTTQ